MVLAAVRERRLSELMGWEENSAMARPYSKSMMATSTRPLRLFYLTLGVVVTGAVIGVFMEGADSSADQLEELSDVFILDVGVPGDEAGQAQAVALAQPAPAQLRGEGPVVVELHWLGRAFDELAVVKRGGSLRGRVVGERGIPIPFSTVEILGGPQAKRSVECDQDGVYRLDGLLPGTHLFRITAGSMQAGRLQRILPRGPTRRDFFVAAPTSLLLKILGNDGKPLVGAEISGDLGMVFATSNDEGIAELFGISRGPRVLIDVNAEGHAATRHELNLLPTNPGVAVKLGPLPRSGRLRGEVKSWPGGPLPTISVAPRALRPASWTYQWERWHGVQTDPQGRYAIDGLPSSLTVDVRAEHPSGVSKPASRAVRPGAASPATASFVIVERKQTLAGVVRDAQGKPLGGVVVRLEAQDPLAVLGALYPGIRQGAATVQLPTPAALRRELRTGKNGKFTFSWADHPKGSGSLVLSASKDGYLPARSVVRNARSDFAMVMEPVKSNGKLSLETLSYQAFPEVEWWVDNRRQGESGPELGGLLNGSYRIRVSRGTLELFSDRSFHVGMKSRLELR